jgi:hypothetical protein
LRQPAGRRAKYSVDDLVEQLANDSLKTVAFQKRCHDEIGMSSGWFYVLLKQAAGKLLHKNRVDDTWEVIKKNSRNSTNSN